MLPPLDAALLPALLCALALVPATLAGCHAVAALASLVRPVADDLHDVALAILAWIRPKVREAHLAPTLLVPLTGIRSVDLPILHAFA